MVEDRELAIMVDTVTTEDCLSKAQALVPIALKEAKVVKGFPGRWKMIISKLEQIPSKLSDLSSHPCFLKNSLCKEQIQAVTKTLNEVIELADLCVKEKYEGKLRMQSDLDCLLGKLNLNLRDCGLLIKTGVLGEVSFPSSVLSASTGVDTDLHCYVRELFARLQIGHLEAKHKALDSLIEVMKEDEKNVFSVLGRSNIAALVQLLRATSPQIREKTASIICSLSESENCQSWLVSEGVLPPLTRLAESGCAIGREKATISLQRLSMSSEAAHSIIKCDGIRALIDVCRSGDYVSQAAAVCTLKNISFIIEAHQTLAKEGIAELMISLLDNAVVLESKEYAAECLQNLTSGNDNICKSVVAEGGIRSLLEYMDGPLPRESTVCALRNLVYSVPSHDLIALGMLPRLARVLKSGTMGARQAAASTICRIGSLPEMKRLISDAGCIPLLVKMLESKVVTAREVAAQAISCLITLPHNCQQVKREEKSIPNLVQLLDPSPDNTCKKYAVSSLLMLASTRNCKKMMISYGAIGYLKKLGQMEVPGAKKLLDRLERGTLKSLFSK